MEQVTAALIIKALDGLALRQSYTAQNIANADSPNYTPVRVTFEESLRSAARQGPGAIADVKPSAEAALDEAGSSGTRLDLELATASQTAERYGALMELLSRQLALRHALIMDGGR